MSERSWIFQPSRLSVQSANEKMLISIKDFAVTGHFGPVQIGMTTLQVTTLLGTPGDTGDFGGGNSGLIYGGYEFLFFDDRLIGMQNEWIDFSDPKCVSWRNDNIKIDPWILTGERGTKFAEILSACQEDRVPCETIEYYGRPGLRMKSGVILDFGPPEGDGILIAIRYSPKI